MAKKFDIGNLPGTENITKTIANGSAPERKTTKKEHQGTVPQKEPQEAVPVGYRITPEPKSKRLNLLIRPSVYDALKQNAIVQNVSVNQLINEILQNYIKGE